MSTQDLIDGLLYDQVSDMTAYHGFKFIVYRNDGHIIKIVKEDSTSYHFYKGEKTGSIVYHTSGTHYLINAWPVCKESFEDVFGAKHG